MRVELSDKNALEEGLFRFLLRLSDGEVRAGRPLAADNETLRQVFQNPAPELAEAFRRRIDGFLLSLGTAPETWGRIQAPSSVLGAVLAFHNCLCLVDAAPAPSPSPAPAPAPPPAPAQVPARPTPEEKKKSPDPLSEFTAELVANLPPATDINQCLAWHAALKRIGPALRQAKGEVAELLRGLIDRSPLTSLRALDVHTPPALENIASDLLPGWRDGKDNQAVSNPMLQGWEDLACDLVSRPAIGKWLAQGWVFLPETRTACRNLGLVLEMLRRKGGFRELILAFYESYDYFRAEKETDDPHPLRRWPVMSVVERLLRFPGDTDAALAATRRGNEYFLKFRPLLEIVLEENGVPPEYRLLSREFFRELRRLAHFATFGQRQASLGEISFEST